MKLYKHQEDSITKLKKVRGWGLFNEPQTGKTAIAINLLFHQKIKGKVNIIIVPKVLLNKWRQEILIWFSNFDIFVPNEYNSINKRIRTYNEWITDGKELDNKIIITTPIVGQMIIKNIKEIGVFIIDEAHNLSNHKAKTTKFYLLEAINKAEYKGIITGTPLRNHLGGMFSMIGLMGYYPSLSKKTIWGLYKTFEKQYLITKDLPTPNGHFTKICGWKKDALEILQDKISHISVNYKMKDIFRDMPDSTIEDFYIDVTTEQKKYISILLKNGEVQTPKRWLSIYNGAEALANLQLYQVLTTFPERYGIKGAKTEWLLEYLEEIIIPNNQKTIIFSKSRTYLEYLGTTKIGKYATYLTGENKKGLLEFTEDSDKLILLAQVDAAGVGITLDFVNVIVFTDLPYSPASWTQACGRNRSPYRNKANKEIIRLLCKDTIDEVQLESLNKNQNLASQINDYAGMINRRYMKW